VRKAAALGWILFVLLLGVACNSMQEPEINVEVKVTELSDEEYSAIGTRGLEDPVKDDFRKVKISLNVVQFVEITAREVQYPETEAWKNAINSIDGDRYWVGNRYERNNDNENTVEYTEEFIFYYKGLSEDEVKQAFESLIFKISWITKQGTLQSKEFEVSEIIESVSDLPDAQSEDDNNDQVVTIRR